MSKMHGKKGSGWSSSILNLFLKTEDNFSTDDF